MSPRNLHYAANDARFIPFPFDRPRPRLSLIDAPRPAPQQVAAIEFVIASHTADLDAADALVERCYGWRGYRTDAQERTTGETTLLARRGGALLGTITVRCGVRARLQAETGFAEHVGELRRQGCRLAEYTRFAIDRDALAAHGIEVELAPELIQRALLLGRVMLGATDCLIEVNPRHARYYQRQFGFREYGPQRTCERVGAPARLLHLNLARPPDCIVVDLPGRPLTRLH